MQPLHAGSALQVLRKRSATADIREPGTLPHKPRRTPEVQPLRGCSVDDGSRPKLSHQANTDRSV